MNKINPLLDEEEKGMKTVCRTCEEEKCEDWCGKKEYNRQICICEEAMWEQSFVVEFYVEGGHVYDEGFKTFYVCRNAECKNYGLMYFFNL